VSGGRLTRVGALLDGLVAAVPLALLPDAVVFGSAALALRGVDLGREIGDLDVLVSEVTLERVTGRLGPGAERRGSSVRVTGLADVEIPSVLAGVDHAAVLARATPTPESRGVRVAALEDVVAWKRAQGRPKDLADLAKTSGREPG
jgi:hypothetical protein